MLLAWLAPTPSYGGISLALALLTGAQLVVLLALLHRVPGGQPGLVNPVGVIEGRPGLGGRLMHEYSSVAISVFRSAGHGQ